MAINNIGNYCGQTHCWYSGVKVDFINSCDIPISGCQEVRKLSIATLATREHIFPRHTFDFNWDGTNIPKNYENNFVLASHVCNNLVANSPVCVKFEIRRKFKAYMDGRTELVFSDLRELEILANTVIDKYRVGRMPVWSNCTITLSTGERVEWFTIENPHGIARKVPFTLKDLENRNKIFEKLVERDEQFRVMMFDQGIPVASLV